MVSKAHCFWTSAKNAHRSKTVKVLAKAYANGSSDGSVNARFQKVGSL
jgi:peptide methionine sulfoxide reductase MsrA